MFRRTFTFVLLALNLIVGLSIFALTRAERSAALREMQLRQLVPEGEIDRLHWSARGNANPVTLVRRGDSWWVDGPDAWPANPEVVTTLIGLLRQPRPIAILPAPTGADAAEQRANWGLAEPDVTLEATLGDTTTRIQFGRIESNDGSVYAEVLTDGFVRVIPRGSTRILLAPEAALRNPTLLTIPAFESRGLSYQFSAGQGLKVRIAPVGEGNWRLEAPLVARADRQRVERLFQRLNQLRVLAFLDPSDASEFRVPQIRLTVEGNNRQQTLLFYGPPMVIPPGQTTPVPESELVVTRLENRDALFVIPSDIIKELESSVEVLRDRRMLTFEPAEASEIRISVPERTPIVLQRGEGGTWQVIARDARDQAVVRPGDAQRIDALIDILAQSQITRFVSNAPTQAELEGFELVSPQRIVTVVTRRGEQTLHLGRVDTAERMVHARIVGEPFVYGTGMEILNSLPVVSYAYRDRNLRAAPAAAGALRLILFPFAGEEPIVSLEPRASDVDSPAGRLAAALAPLRAVRHVSDAFNEAGPVSADLPWTHRLRVESAAQSAGYTLFLRRTGDRTWLAGLSDSSAVFEPTPELSAALEDLLEAAGR
jgi:hypothetical protein